MGNRTFIMLTLVLLVVGAIVTSLRRIDSEVAINSYSESIAYNNGREVSRSASLIYMTDYCKGLHEIDIKRLLELEDSLSTAWNNEQWNNEQWKK